VNRDGGESDVVAERSGAGTPKAPRPIPADWPDSATNPAIATPEMVPSETETGTGTGTGTDAEAEADAAAESDDRAKGDEPTAADGAGAEKEVRSEAGPTG
jgi:hypothetical protein